MGLPECVPVQRGEDVDRQAAQTVERRKHHSGTGDERNNDRNEKIAPAPAHGSGHRLQPQQPTQNGACSRLGAGIDFEHDLALTGAGAIDAAWHERLVGARKIVESAFDQLLLADLDLLALTPADRGVQ